MGGCCSWLFGRRLPKPSDRDPLLPRPPTAAAAKTDATESAPPPATQSVASPRVLCEGCSQPVRGGETGVTAGAKN